jgi:hypothetical protein
MRRMRWRAISTRSYMKAGLAVTRMLYQVYPASVHHVDMAGRSPVDCVQGGDVMR